MLQNPIVNGYIDGEYVYVAPTVNGILDEISITKGQKIKAGDNLFAVDKEIWKTRLNVAENELSVAKEQQEQAEATLINAEKEYYLNTDIHP